MGAHARLGPSDKTWPHCPGSPRVNAEYVDVAGEAAIDGTGSHELLELCLKNGVRAETYDGQIVGANHEDNPMGWLVGLDRIERVQQGLDYVSRRVAELSKVYPHCKITVEAETRSNPGEKIERDDWWGTVDITITVSNPFDTVLFIEVIDYKDGRMYVSEKNNSQLLSYAIGKLDMTAHATPYRVTIIQPKTSPSVRYEDGTVGSLRAHFNILGAAAVATDDPNAPLIAGKHCTWCSHGRAKNCTAASEQSLEKVRIMTNNVEVPSGSLFESISETFGDITTLPSEKLEELLDAQPGLMAAFDRVRTEIQRRVDDPDDHTVKGYAMLPGRNSQSWAEDEDAIVKMLKARRLKKDQIYPASLITPAAMKKLDCLTKDQKDKIAAKYIESKAGKDTLQKVRKSVEPVDAAMMFGDIQEVKPISFF
jgi:hypothetical protein